jgi:hypothetical protein
LSLAVRRSREDRIKELMPRSPERVVSDAEIAVSGGRKYQAVEQ